MRTALFYFANETSSGNDENPSVVLTDFYQAEDIRVGIRLQKYYFV